MDVKGVEWGVLAGAESIMNQIRSWLIELHNTSRKDELESLLNSYGYQHRWVDGSHTFAWGSEWKAFNDTEDDYVSISSARYNRIYKNATKIA